MVIICWRLAHSRHRSRPKDLANISRNIQGSNLSLLALGILFSFSNLHFGAAYSDIDNEIVGSPLVECERDLIRFSVPTKKPFRGKVYVKGEFANEDCVRLYTDNDYDYEKEDISINHHHKKYPIKSEGDDEYGSGDEQMETYTPGSNPKSGTDPPPDVTIFDDKRRHNSRGSAGRTTLGSSAPTEKTFGGQLAGFDRKNHRANNWRSFLRGRPDGKDGQQFRRYGSRMSPDANGECPLECPPCEELTAERHRRTATHVYDYSSRHAENEENTNNKKKTRSSTRMASLEVFLGTCNTRRDRMANPPGVHVSFTVVVNFHNNFITKIDKAYHVECAYEESDRTVTTQIDVSAPPSIDLTGVVEPPQCHYHIFPSERHSSESSGVTLNDFSLKNVRVGDSVRHEWICTRSASDAKPADTGLSGVFGLLVHDCYVDDGRGRREPVIDSKGCSLSPLILPTPSYASDALIASVDSLVAKFPDRDLLGFQCAITVCMRESGDCDGVTPPTCEQPAANRTRRSAHGLSDWQLNAPVLTVFDANEEYSEEFRSMLSKQSQGAPNERLTQQHLKTSTYDEEFCVSITAFGILVAGSTFIITISSTITFTVLFLNVQFNTHHQEPEKCASIMTLTSNYN